MAHSDQHKEKHVNGVDDIRDSTNALKGLATAAQITAVEANAAHAAEVTGNPHVVTLEEARTADGTLAGDVAMGGNEITGLPSTPGSGSAAACRDYVQAQIHGLDPKDSVDAATTEALPANTRAADVLTATANAEFPAIDGVAAVLNQEYLVKNEVEGINDGIYKLTTLGDVGAPWALTRRADLAGGSSSAGAYMFVEDGTVNGEKQFVCTNNAGTDVVNTDALSFSTSGAVSDHGDLIGLADDDHTQYHNDTRGDARYYTETELDGGQLDNRYFTETEHVDASVGGADAGKPIKLDAEGHVDATMINDGDVDHENVGGLLGGAAADHYHLKSTEHTLALDHKTMISMAGDTPVLADMATLVAEGDWALMKNAAGTILFLGAMAGAKKFAVELGEVIA